jgi:hypothetical protein
MKYLRESRILRIWIWIKLKKYGAGIGKGMATTVFCCGNVYVMSCGMIGMEVEDMSEWYNQLIMEPVGGIYEKIFGTR